MMRKTSSGFPALIGVGPGVYDIHSSNIPREWHRVELMPKTAERIPSKRLRVNPDCGPKARQWDEVVSALTRMGAAAEQLRPDLGDAHRAA